PRQRQYGFEHRLAIEELQKQKISAVAQSNQGGRGQGERNAQQGDQKGEEYGKLHAPTPVPAIITLRGLLLPPSCTNREFACESRPYRGSTRPREFFLCG